MSGKGHNEDEPRLTRIGYTLFRWSFSAYLISALVSLTGLALSALAGRFSWLWGVPFVAGTVLMLVAFPVSLALATRDDRKDGGGVR